MTIPVADAHCDFLYYAVEDGYNLYRPKYQQVITRDRLRAGNVKLQFFAVWTDAKSRKKPLNQCLDMISEYTQIMAKHGDEFVPFDSSYSPDSASIATVLTIEDGQAMAGNLRNLDIFYKLGVRAMTLTWNNVNDLGYPAKHKKNIGLTELGKATVRRMNELGIAIDFAHLSDAGIDDVFEILSENDRPPFSSHTNSRAVYPSKRSLCDEHILEISRRGGVIGVNFFYEQLGPNPIACIDDIVRHIDYIASVGGINCVAIGSDFDGMGVYPRDMKNSGDFPALICALQKLGYSDDELYKIMYGNLAGYISRFTG